MYGTIHFGETRLLEILLRVYLPLILELGRENKLQASGPLDGSLSSTDT